MNVLISPPKSFKTNDHYAQRKTPLVVPATVQRQAGIKAGDRVQFRASRGMITILTTPPPLDGHPSADQDEYTPEQRRAIHVQLAESLEDVRSGRVYGPFATAPELERSLHRTARKAAAKPRRSAR